MDIEDYQEKAERTVDGTLSAKENICNLVFGLNGETGEVTELIKKSLFHGHKLKMEKLIEELGDVMWYLTNLASIFEIPMSEILYENIKKLEERYPEGFSEEKSKNRKEYK